MMQLHTGAGHFRNVIKCTVTRIDGKLHQLHRVAQTKQSGWWEIISTFAMDIFGFFQHFRCKFSTVSKISEYILYSKDGNFWLFEIFRLYFLSKDGNFQFFVIFRFWFLFKRWNSQTFEMVFPDGNALRKLNSTGWDRSSVPWPSALPLRHTFPWLDAKKRYRYFGSTADEYCLLVFLCCRKRLSPK